MGDFFLSIPTEIQSHRAYHIVHNERLRLPYESEDNLQEMLNAYSNRTYINYIWPEVSFQRFRYATRSNRPSYFMENMRLQRPKIKKTKLKSPQSCGTSTT
jgi:hypothetical protein